MFWMGLEVNSQFNTWKQREMTAVMAMAMARTSYPFPRATNSMRRLKNVPMACCWEPPWALRVVESSSLPTDATERSSRVWNQFPVSKTANNSTTPGSPFVRLTIVPIAWSRDLRKRHRGGVYIILRQGGTIHPRTKLRILNIERLKI
jgi:hypothetical protein